MDRSGGGFGGRRGGAGTSPLFLEVTLHRLYIISLNHVASQLIHNHSYLDDCI